MARKNQLTNKQMQFAHALARTGDATYAAKRAGYAFPEVTGSKLAKDARIDANRRGQQLAILNNKLLPLALDLFERVLTDDQETTRNRLTAASKVADLTLKQDQNTAQLEPHEMTADQIQARIAELRQRSAEIANSARDVTPEDDDASPIDAGSDDPFG